MNFITTKTSPSAVAVALQQAKRPEFIAYQKQTVQNARVMCKALQDKGYDIVSGQLYH